MIRSTQNTAKYSDKPQPIPSRKIIQNVEKNILQSLIERKPIIQENFVILIERKQNSSFALIH